jgi:hypothetical protein
LPFYIVFILTFIFSSCAKKPEQEVEAAIDQAQTYLTYNKCQRAIDLLEEVGRTKENPIYLQVLASAYACRAGYSEITLLGRDLGNINPAALFPSLSILPLSQTKRAADSQAYQDLRTAINLLLHTDNNQPSQVRREQKYGPRKAGDMGVQALLMMFSQLGKYLNFYGNVANTGANRGRKGSGAANVDEQGAVASNCFFQYDNNNSALLLAIPNGVCTNNRPHPDLDLSISASIRHRRMCEGLMLITNIMDILENISLPDTSSMKPLEELAEQIDQIKSNLNPSLSTLVETTAQQTCETLVAGDEANNAEILFIALFEAQLSGAPWP